MNKTEYDANLAIRYFDCNYVTLAQNGSPMIYRYKFEYIWSMKRHIKIQVNKKVEVVGGIIDNQLEFGKYLRFPCIKTDSKL